MKRIPGIGKRIRKAIANTGLNHQEIAKKLDVGQAQLSKWVNEIYSPSPDALVNISKATNISIDWLLTGHEHLTGHEQGMKYYFRNLCAAVVDISEADSPDTGFGIFVKKAIKLLEMKNGIAYVLRKNKDAPFSISSFFSLPGWKMEDIENRLKPVIDHPSFKNEEITFHEDPNLNGIISGDPEIGPSISFSMKIDEKLIGIVLSLPQGKYFSGKYDRGEMINRILLLRWMVLPILKKLFLIEKLVKTVTTDGLTGIYNYRYFIQRLTEELQRASRYKIPLSLCMIDLDFFKKFNDTYGHLHGDLILIKAAKVLKNVARSVDIVCRYGGEEFAIIMPNTSKKKAEVLLERLRKIIIEHDFPGEHTQPGGELTISMGLAGFPEDVDESIKPKDLIDAADKALYTSKESGRNKLTVHE